MINNTMLKSINTIARKQENPTELMIKWAKQLLDYAATYPDAAIRYYASDMILKQQSDASYSNDEKARSSYGGYAWLV